MKKSIWVKQAASIAIALIFAVALLPIGVYAAFGDSDETIKNTDATVNNETVNGSLTISNGNVTVSNTTVKGDLVLSNSNVSLSNVTVTGALKLTNSIVDLNGNQYSGAVSVVNSELTIDGGTFSANSAFTITTGTVTINGGQYDAPISAATGSILEINGGKFSKRATRSVDFTSMLTENGGEFDVDLSANTPVTPPTTTPTTPPTTPGGNFPFTDVAASAWYYDAVKYVFDNNLFNGTSATAFSPSLTMTNAMMVQVLYNIGGEGKTYQTTSTAWYATAVAWGEENGIMTGLPSFDPTAGATREAMAVMMLNYVNAKNITLTATREPIVFADASSISAWASEAVDAMYAAEVLNGMGNNAFSPADIATRAQVAQMFANFFEAIK